MNGQDDFFISHASEDKAKVALPLAEELRRRGYKVWLDKFKLTVGDSLRAKIDEGLRDCRFGVVILSPNFFRKNWPVSELNALHARATATGQKIILPVWHDLTYEHVGQFSWQIADLLASNTSKGINAVADDIEEAYKQSVAPAENNFSDGLARGIGLPLARRAPAPGRRSSMIAFRLILGGLSAAVILWIATSGVQEAVRQSVRWLRELSATPRQAKTVAQAPRESPSSREVSEPSATPQKAETVAQAPRQSPSNREMSEPSATPQKVETVAQTPQESPTPDSLKRIQPNNALRTASPAPQNSLSELTAVVREEMNNANIVVLNASHRQGSAQRVRTLLRDIFPKAKVYSQEEWKNPWYMVISRIYYKPTQWKNTADAIERWLPGQQETIDYLEQESSQHFSPDRGDIGGFQYMTNFDAERNLIFFLGEEAEAIEIFLTCVNQRRAHTDHEKATIVSVLEQQEHAWDEAKSRAAWYHPSPSPKAIPDPEVRKAIPLAPTPNQVS